MMMINYARPAQERRLFFVCMCVNIALEEWCENRNAKFTPGYYNASTCSFFLWLFAHSTVSLKQQCPVTNAFLRSVDFSSDLWLANWHTNKMPLQLRNNSRLFLVLNAVMIYKILTFVCLLNAQMWDSKSDSEILIGT